MAQGKAVVVTGAAGGIGRATCERLARGGWQVLAADRDADKLGWTEGTDIFAITADVSSEADNARLADAARERFGGLDAAIFNAAVPGGGAIDALPMADFERIVAVNMHGPVLGVRAVLPLLRERGGGAIALTSSTMGIGGDADNWAYSMTKHALIGLTYSLARELGCEGIRVNALCPGPTKTAIAGLEGAGDDAAADLPAHFHLLKKAVPLQRWAEPDEMASVLEFLIGEAASYVNGHALIADGGAICGTGLVAPKTAPEGQER